MRLIFVLGYGSILLYSQRSILNRQVFILSLNATIFQVLSRLFLLFKVVNKSVLLFDDSLSFSLIHFMANLIVKHLLFVALEHEIKLLYMVL